MKHSILMVAGGALALSLPGAAMADAVMLSATLDGASETKGGSPNGSGTFQAEVDAVVSRQVTLQQLALPAPALQAELGGRLGQVGLQAGDIILKFDGKDVSDFQSLVLRVSEKRPGDKVKLQIQRGEEMLEIELIIGRKRRD